LEAFFNATSGRYPPEVLNTGELADSLMGEKYNNPFSEFIISLFENQTKHQILFLTKSNNVENLLAHPSTGQVIMSFSVNAKAVAEKWEQGAPSPKERIEGAKKIAKAGYIVRVRIDPIVPTSNWREQYTNILDQIFTKFVPERITLGSLRGLQSTINAAQDKSWVNFLSETSNWGKRVNFDLRYSIYRTLLDHMERRYGYANVALCKETIEMWDKLELNWINCKCNCVA
jgi:spore photoproduct lyase